MMNETQIQREHRLDKVISRLKIVVIEGTNEGVLSWPEAMLLLDRINDASDYLETREGR